MIRQFFFASAVGGFLFALVHEARAAKSDTAAVRITIKPVDLLSVTNAGAISLIGTAGSNVLSGPADSTARLHYSHNAGTPKKITAAISDAGGSGHDITVTISIAGGSGTRTLMLSGASQPPQEVYSAVPVGALFDRAVTYSASCTASGTRVTVGKDFIFWVAFTSTD